MCHVQYPGNRYRHLEGANHPSKSYPAGTGYRCRRKGAFELRGSEVVVTRVEDQSHEDPAIEAFLALLENDIRAGKNLTTLPEDMAQTMVDNLHRSADLSEEIVGPTVL